MPKSDKMKDHADKAATEYEAHLERAEDHLAASAQKAEDSFREHTAGAEARLEKAEDHLEASAKKVNRSS